MSGKRQKNQNQLAFWFAGASEACFDGQEGTGTPVGEREAESPAGKQQLRLLKSSTNSNRRIRTRTYGGVGGAEERSSPLSRSRVPAPRGQVAKCEVIFAWSLSQRSLTGCPLGPALPGVRSTPGSSRLAGVYVNRLTFMSHTRRRRVRDTKVDAEAIHQQNGLNPSV